VGFLLMKKVINCVLLSLGFLCTLPVVGDAPGAEDPGALAARSNQQESEIVTYPARFFDQYQPLTALDMVRQVPGFQVNDGDDLRGFGGAAGNILINDRRPSAKQDLASAILSRIPAANVKRIDLIRGQSQDINMLGHTIVANVIMSEDVLATNRWETSMTYTSPSPLGLGTSLSLSDQWANIDYNFGLDLERDTNGITGTVERYNAENTLSETRVDNRKQTGIALRGVYLNASSLLGRTLYNLNTKIGFRESDGLEVSRRTRLAPVDDPYDIYFIDKGRQPQIEIGIDAERLLNPELQGKAIFLLTHRNQDATSSEESIHSSGDRFRFRLADEETVTTEGIARVEFDWSGWAGHAVKANIEGAYNVLDNGLVLTDDRGNGPVVLDVPNANSRVEEIRGDVLLNDIWSLGQWVWEYGLGAETSTITQTGDADQQRSFFFFKPKSLLTYSPNKQQQSRLRLAREVAQLNFNEFVSTTIFVDDDLVLGNPNLKPETTWIAELSHEHRFGDLGVVTLTGFHHWITDVMDLLPVTDQFEVPGNIGDGRRWGLELASTLPLTWINLTGARLDLRMRWQDSKVTDPVTGNTRELSADGGFSGPPGIPIRSENDYVVDIIYRQDFEGSAWAWGWDTAFQADRPVYKVNELETFGEGLELNAFIETTRWLGMKIRVDGHNLLNYLEVRDRLIYTGRRELTLLQQRELRLRKPSRVFMLTFSGNF
jgi:outer membrane receptor protein involved in Fe transport